ncbi:GGDEF domain-containing protein [Halodesulfovibrio marinisediminis]|uniref:PAS domain S-box-containing protein/diguanylate cyclase (GGDEF) domain-containing protein n=1 Tax=Halodesulfovibrio marinisediminis DSM 17456 TaxID=1121457 RepID=A0A1N6GQJ1_9BACT|nr:sensor domain-containing diguanylate cyclase [Halodesulfovibrio marinisediminis]SIO09705.1 PAS domain S-box-containing protein/diguanylate cyclase (GGDEF) domain-containing protein [Halodesulfovibrio marinisediminis DSM 17456]
MQRTPYVKPTPSSFEVAPSTVQENETGMWYWEPLADTFYFSESYLARLGYNDDETPTSSADLINIIHPEDLTIVQRIQENYIYSAKDGNRYEHRLRVRARSGNYFSIVVHGYILHRDSMQRATMVSGFHINSERLATIDHEEQRMKFALQAAEDGIWDWNAETNEVYYSPKYIAMAGYTEDEFPPTADSWASRVHPDDYESTVAMQLQIINSPDHGDSFECIYRFLHKEGHWIWILGKGVVTSRKADGKARRVTGVHIDINELQNAKENLIKTLKKDTLTAVYSRYSFEQRLETITTADYPVSLIYVDADGLKIVNDLLGHTYGDEYLRKISSMLARYTRNHDSIYRIGGDEFVILLPNTGRKNANEALLRLKNKIEEQSAIGDSPFVSFGLSTAMFPDELDTLTSNADTHMYENKRINQEERHKLIRQFCLDIISKTKATARNVS